MLEGQKITDLSRQQLEQLASVLGNSAVLSLLKSAGSSPETCSFNCPTADCNEEKVNQIKTEPPELIEAPEMSRYIDKPWSAFYPGNICDRAVPTANDAEFNGMLLMTNDEI